MLTSSRVLAERPQSAAFIMNKILLITGGFCLGVGLMDLPFQQYYLAALMAVFGGTQLYIGWHRLPNEKI